MKLQQIAISAGVSLRFAYAALASRGFQRHSLRIPDCEAQPLIEWLREHHRMISAVASSQFSRRHLKRQVFNPSGDRWFIFSSWMGARKKRHRY